MKDIHKNPTLYYILVPIMVAVWPLLVLAVYLPGAEDNWKIDKNQYNKAQKIIEEILDLDPKRLGFAGLKTGDAEFGFASAIKQVADLYDIPSTNYKLSSGMLIAHGGQKSQSCHVVLTQIDIARFAKFLSTMQLRWVNLQCSKVKLTKKKGFPNKWDADLDLMYYY